MREPRYGRHPDAAPYRLACQVNGRNLQVTDTGVDGTVYSYYVVGDYGSHTGIETEDPQIHNVET